MLKSLGWKGEVAAHVVLANDDITGWSSASPAVWQVAPRDRIADSVCLFGHADILARWQPSRRYNTATPGRSIIVVVQSPPVVLPRCVTSSSR